MIGSQMDPQLVSDARALTRNLFGGVLESKASDAFCLNMMRSRQPTGSRGGAFLEAIVAPVAGSVAAPSVIEFESAATPTSPTGPAQRISEARTAAYQQLSEVYDEVDRQSGMTALGGAPSSVGHPRATVLTTQMCWLNHSIRTWADPGIVAEVASKSSVTTVDVSRPLRPDLPALPVNAEAPEADPTGRNGHATVGLRPDIDLSGDGLIVAVIDSEVAAQHPSFAGRVVHRRNFTPNEAWGNPAAHGTAVASIIASGDAVFPGVAADAVIYNYKVLATNALLNADDFGGALAIQQALEDGAVVANCSWGAGPVGGPTSREARAVDRAWELGMVVVKSAGNRGPGAATMTTPAEAKGVLVVGATDLRGTSVQPYSSRGPAGGREGPHLVAPGGDDSVDGSGNLRCALVGGGFGNAGAGTSYATPFVSAAVALHLQKDPNATPDVVRQRLLVSAKQLAEAPQAQGAGMLQIAL
jgi:serine protease AprX